jgi:hypothetical protein
VTGLYFDLSRRGFHVFVDPDQYSSLQYGSWRVAAPEEVDAMVMIIDLPDLQAGAWTPPAGSRLVVSYDPLTAAQRARVNELTAMILESLGPNAPHGRISAGLGDVLLMEQLGVQAAPLEELHELQQLGDGYNVYLAPPLAA